MTKLIGSSCGPSKAAQAMGCIYRICQRFTCTSRQSNRSERIAHDRHPDHQFRIDRRASDRRVLRCKFAAKPRQIESSVDLPH